MTMASSMTPRKRVKNEHPYPDDWTVYFEWEFEPRRGKVTRVVSRQHDVKVGQSWYLFERYVVKADGTSWIDCFEMHPYGGYRAFRPNEVSQVRQHVKEAPPKGRAK